MVSVDFKFAQNPAGRVLAIQMMIQLIGIVKRMGQVSVPSTIQAIKNEDGGFKYEPPIYAINDILGKMTLTKILAVKLMLMHLL